MSKCFPSSPGIEIQFHTINSCQSLSIHLFPRARVGAFINQNVTNVYTDLSQIKPNDCNFPGLKIFYHTSIKETFPSHAASRGTFLTYRVPLFPSVVASTFYYISLNRAPREISHARSRTARSLAYD